MSESKTTKIPGYFTYHWEKNAQPTGSWWLAKDGTPNKDHLRDGFFAVYHPEIEIETTMMPCVVENQGSWAEKIKKIDLSKYIPIGQKLTWSQRWNGVA